MFIMGMRIRDFGRCPVCNKKLRRSAERCTECSRLYNVFKNKHPGKSDESINKMIMNHYKNHRYGSYNRGSKPKFLNVKR